MIENGNIHFKMKEYKSKGLNNKLKFFYELQELGILMAEYTVYRFKVLGRRDIGRFKRK